MVSVVVTGLTGHTVNSGLRTQTETGKTNDSELDTPGSRGPADRSKPGALAETGLANISVSDIRQANISQSDSVGARQTDSSKGNLLTETDETDGLFMASMAVIGLTGQIWGAFIISEFMTGRVKSSRTGPRGAMQQ